MPEHSVITDPNIHEPKGASTAAADTVYVSDGAGSGTWQKLGTASVDDTEFLNINEFTVCGWMADISTADVIYLPVPMDCVAVEATFTIQAIITGADAIVTFMNNAGATMATQTVTYSSSGAGDTYQTSLSANNVFTAGQKMSISTDGGSTSTSKVFFVIRFRAT